MYVKKFSKPYESYKDRPDTSTPVTAAIKNMETDTFLAVEDYIAGTVDTELEKIPTNEEKQRWNNKVDINELPTKLSDLSDDANHRLVTDEEKSTWDGKAEASDIPSFENKSTLDKFSESSNKLMWDGKPIEGGGGASSWSELTGKPFETIDQDTLKVEGGKLSVIGGADGEPIVHKQSGNPLKLSSVDAPLIDFIIHGYTNTTDGLKSLGDLQEDGSYAVRVDERNANLWDEEWGTSEIVGGTLNSKGYIDVKPSNSYTPICPTSIVFQWFDSSKTQIGGNVVIGTTNRTRTSPSNAKYLRFFTSTDYGTTYNHDIAIIEGTSGSYVPHEGQTVFIPTSQPLQDGDSISYHVDGSGVEHRKMGVVTSTELYSNYMTKNDGANVDDWLYWIRFDKSTSDALFSDKFEIVDNAPTGKNGGKACLKSTTRVIYINFYGLITTNTLDAVKQWIRDNSFSFVYELATPTDTPLTADQVAELKKLKTYADETNISTDTLASMDVTHYANNDNASTVADIQKQVLVDKPSDYHVYSTEEKVVGEWVDGSPIYERVLEFDSLIGIVSNTWYVIPDFDFSYCKYCVYCGGMNSDGAYFPLSGGKANNNLQIMTYRNAPVGITKIILKYTKTTDTPSLASEPMMASEVTPIEIAGEVDDGPAINPNE